MSNDAPPPELKTPPILVAKTQTLIREVQKKLGHPLVTYWNGPNGAICANDVNGLYGLLRNMGKQEKLSLFIKSDGGSGQSSLRKIGRAHV